MRCSMTMRRRGRTDSLDASEMLGRKGEVSARGRPNDDEWGGGKGTEKQGGERFSKSGA